MPEHRWHRDHTAGYMYTPQHAGRDMHTVDHTAGDMHTVDAHICRDTNMWSSVPALERMYNPDRFVDGSLLYTHTAIADQ